MLQINDDFYVRKAFLVRSSSLLAQEDLTEETTKKVLDELAAGRKPKPGPQNGRRAAEGPMVRSKSIGVSLTTDRRARPRCSRSPLAPALASAATCELEWLYRRGVKDIKLDVRLALNQCVAIAPQHTSRVLCATV